MDPLNVVSRTSVLQYEVSGSDVPGGMRHRNDLQQVFESVVVSTVGHLRKFHRVYRTVLR